MNVLVVVVVALASALVRERGEMLGGWQPRMSEPYAVVLPRIVEAGVEAAVGGGGAGEVAGATTDVVARDPDPAAASSEAPSDPAVASNDGSALSGQWEIACEIKSGSALVFDRGSLREYGAMTLVRWSAPRTRLAAPGDQIFTAVVNCREKTIEPAWPGRSRETHVGTCGRGLVEAVCAASSQSATSAGGHRPIDPSTSRIVAPHR